MDDGEAAFEARRGLGFARLSRGVLQVTGGDARDFLNGLATNDVAGMKAGRCLYAALLDHRGRSLADLWVYDVGAGFLIDVDADIRKKVMGLLVGGRVSEDVQIVDRSEEFARLVVLGAKLPESVRSLLNTPPPDPGHWTEIPSGLMSRAEPLSSPCVDLFLDPSTDVEDRLATSGGIALSLGAREILRLESGLPRYGTDFDEDTILLEAGMESAVSFTKGCYVGQEVISRVANRGHLRRTLVSLVLDASPPKPESPVTLHGNPVGRITSAAHSRSLGKTIAFAILSSELSRPGTNVEVMTAEGASSATVAATPAVE